MTRVTPVFIGDCTRAFLRRPPQKCSWPPRGGMAYAASQPIMTHPAPSPPHRPHLDCFLHADVGQERNGMDLGVLSVLARLDKDP